MKEVEEATAEAAPSQIAVGNGQEYVRVGSGRQRRHNEHHTEAIAGFSEVQVGRQTACESPFQIKDGQDAALRRRICAAHEEVLQDPEGADLEEIAARHNVTIRPNLNSDDQQVRLSIRRNAMMWMAAELGELEQRLRQGERLQLLSSCYTKDAARWCQAGCVARLLHQRVDVATYHNTEGL